MPLRRFLLLSGLIVLAALLLRGALATWWQHRLDAAGEIFAMGDSVSYWYLAQQLAADRPYQYYSPEAAVFRVPGYPWLLSWFADPDRSGVGVLGARWMGAVGGAATAGLLIFIVAFTVRRLLAHHASPPPEPATAGALPPRAAWAGLIAGCLAACYPGGLTMSVLVLSEAPFQLLMVAVLGCWTGGVLTPGPPSGLVWAIAAGLLSGLAVLVRPSWLLMPPFFYLLWLCGAAERGRVLRSGLAAGLAMVLVLSPWWVRNYRLTGHFVPTTLQVGASLYDGWHAGASGASDSGMQFSLEMAERLRAEDRQRQSEAFARGETPPPPPSLEYRIDRRLARDAVAWAQANPGEALRLAAMKVRRTWWPWPSSDQVPMGVWGRWLFAIGMLGIVLPALGWLLRSVLHSRRNSESPSAPHGAPLHARIWLVWWTPTLYFALLHAVFVGSIRYRQPAVLALCVIAALQSVAWWFAANDSRNIDARRGSTARHAVAGAAEEGGDAR
jgi:hypothetical protein